MAAKKQQKRPPRQVWAVQFGDGSMSWWHHASEGEAKVYAKSTAHLGARVVGPYVLAERVRER